MSETMSNTDISNNLDAFWMPFTANRQFKNAPRLLVSAKGMHYQSHDGRQILDGTAGLWCVNAGHCHPKITEAIRAQAGELDYAPPFQMAHPQAFELASRLTAMTPGDLDHVFFGNSGSEAVDTALKIALAYHRARGDAGRVRLIGRERGYHGVGFGGIAVGGMVGNRKQFGALFAGVDHLPHTYDPKRQAYSRGQPTEGAELADALERLVGLHDASTIAAVIVEPMAGSTGVLIPPKGYLEKLRAICDKYGILLIFDEVITGFGRLGTAFGADYFGVQPDMMTTAKGITNAAVPMSAVFTSDNIFKTLIEATPEGGIELAHGYTYSSHPLATAAALATLDVYRDEGLFQRAHDLSPYWEDAIHSLKGTRHVVDLRNIGLVGAIELEPRPGAPLKRAYEVFTRCYADGVLVRQAGDAICLSPPLIIEKSQIDQIVETLRKALQTVE
jgi:beta-alanine--pyruvate transaminase